MELLTDFSVTSISEKDGIKEYALKSVPFIAGQFNSSIPREINVLPKPGRYTHKLYGEIVVTAERNQEFINNFNNEVYQKLIPIDLEHETSLSGAVGYYEPNSGRVASDGSGWIGVTWEERGIRALSEGRFYYFSPAWFDVWMDPVTNTKFRNVLVGGALTTNPYYKDKALKPLYASEMKEASNMADPKKCAQCAAEYAEDPDMPHKCAEVEPDEDDTKKNKPFSQNYTSSSNAGSVTVTFTNPSQDTIIKVNPEQENHVSEVDPKAFAEMQEKLSKFSEMEGELKKANEMLARQSESNRKRHFSEIIRGVDAEGDGARKFRGDTTVHASVLEALCLQFGEESEEFGAYVTEMRSLAEQLEQSELLKNKGTVGDKNPSTTSDAVDKFFSAVAEYMKENKVNEAAATVAVSGAQPKLYSEYRKASYARNQDEE